MKSTYFNIMTTITLWAMRLFLLITVGVTIFLPRIINMYLPYITRGKDFNNFILVMLIPCGILVAIIILQLISILKSIRRGTPFIIKNAICLMIISISCLIITIIFFIKCLFYPTFLTSLVAFVFLLVSSCAFVFSKLFQQAVEYKAENDLTI